MSSEPPDSIPLCVDLDGTLIRTDTLHEGLLLLAKRDPLALLRLPGWIMAGKQHCKRQIAARVELDVAFLPYREELVERCRGEAARGRPIYLATGADEAWAAPVAGHLGFFAGVAASDGRINLTGEAKRKHLVERFGDRQFDYAGDSRADLAVWPSARGAILVNAGAAVAAAARASTPVLAEINDRGSRWRSWRKALRLHQWSKNILLLAPLLLAHQGRDPAKLLAAFTGMLALSLVASAFYLFNDLLDIPEDRRHGTKKNRPLAAGTLTIRDAALAIPMLAAAGFLLAWRLPPDFKWALLAYLAITLLYSAWLKRKLYFDILVLSLLYALRIVAGGYATGVVISPWLGAFSIFFFSSLALAKRVSELFNRGLKAAPEWTPGRPYSTHDHAALAMMGISAAYVAVLVLALYINSPDVVKLYGRPEAIWLAIPCFLYWLSRFWLIAWRGQLEEDPVVFALRDKTSYLTGAAILVAIALAR